MTDTKDIIGTLVADLKPVGPPAHAGKTAALWWVSALVVCAATMALVAPFRAGFADQLLSTPRFLIESALGLLACAGMARFAFELGIPDSRSHSWRARYIIALVAIWVGLFLVALEFPVLPVSMAGKREHCVIETFIYGLPLAGVGLLFVRRMMPLGAVKTGAWIGFAAGMIPAYLMQFACMHIASHIILHHLLPVLAVALFGALLGPLILRRTQSTL